MEDSWGEKVFDWWLINVVFLFFTVAQGRGLILRVVALTVGVVWAFALIFTAFPFFFMAVFGMAWRSLSEPD